MQLATTSRAHVGAWAHLGRANCHRARAEKLATPGGATSGSQKRACGVLGRVRIERICLGSLLGHVARVGEATVGPGRTRVELATSCEKARAGMATIGARARSCKGDYGFEGARG